MLTGMATSHPVSPLPPPTHILFTVAVIKTLTQTHLGKGGLYWAYRLRFSSSSGKQRLQSVIQVTVPLSGKLRLQSLIREAQATVCSQGRQDGNQDAGDDAEVMARTWLTGLFLTVTKRDVLYNP